MRVFIYLLLLCLLSALAVNSHAEGVILIMGDSLSAGYGISKEKSWPALLQRKLDRSGLPYRVVNASISGDTTHGGLSRLPESLAREKPDIVVIELGANDGLRGLGLQKSAANLKKMAVLSQAYGAKLLLLGIQLPQNYGPDYRARFSDLYGQVAKETGAALVPFFLQGIAETRAMMQPDGLHPTAAAQPMILDNVWKKLASLLE
jgi:acyl-CoA thioesterase-1